MGELEIKEVGINEAKQIADLKKGQWCRIQSLQNNKHHVVVAFAEGKPVGFLLSDVAIEKDAKQQRLIWEPSYVFVDEDNRHKGIAHTLLPLTADWLANKIFAAVAVAPDLQTIFQPRIDIQSAGGRAVARSLIALIGTRIEQGMHALKPLPNSISNKVFQFSVIRL